MTAACCGASTVEGASEWVRAHEALSRLARERARADAEEGRWLLAALRSGAHLHLGFGSFGEYVERLFGYKPRSTQEKLLRAAPTANQNADPSGNARTHESARTGARRKVVGSNSPTRAHTGARAKQTTPPATRRAVRRRDHQRCVAPGCRNALFLDLHHIDLSSEGGSNDPDNLITLCGAHHRAAHRGELSVSGRVSTGIRFQHPDGSGYGQPPQARRVDVQAKFFSALRGLGFREGEVRRVLGELNATDEGRSANLEPLLRAALARLTSRRESG